MICRAVVLTSLLVPALAAADADVKVTLTTEGQLYAATTGRSAQQMADDIKKQVDEAYQTANIPGFLRAFADATSFSQRGIGVDYGSLPNNLIFGLAGNVAAASDSVLQSQEHPTAGAAVNFAAMFGVNLAKQDLPAL